MAGHDFIVRVHETQTGFELRVEGSPAGQATVLAPHPFDGEDPTADLLALENALLRSGGGRRRVDSQQERAAHGLGGRLFEWLMQGDIGKRYDVSREAARRDDAALRIRLRFDAPDLAALPWEFMYDARDRGDYVALSSRTPIVRDIDLPAPVEPLRVEPPLRMLVAIASPVGRQQLDVDRERRRLQEATGDLEARGVLVVEWLVGATWMTLQTAVRRTHPHIFHFVGHGGFDRTTDEGVVLLVDEAGAPFPLSAMDLARLVADEETLRLAVLNACEGARGSERDQVSSCAATLMRFGSPAVVAMRYDITDEAAIAFSRAFYGAIAEGIPVDVAVAEARKAIAVAIEGSLEWGTPVLYLRSTDGVLFDIDMSRAPFANAGSSRPVDAHPSGRPSPVSALSLPAEAISSEGTHDAHVNGGGGADSGGGTTSTGRRGPDPANQAHVTTYRLVVAALAVALLAAIAWNVVQPSEVARVPDARGVLLPVAEERLQAAGLVAGVRSRARYPDTSPDQIVGQEPPPSAKAVRGSTVHLDVSVGLPLVSVPDLCMMTFDQAVAALTARGLVVGKVTTSYHESAPAGTLYDQETRPEQSVAPGSMVDVAVSRGAPPTPSDPFQPDPACPKSPVRPAPGFTEPVFDCADSRNGLGELDAVFRGGWTLMTSAITGSAHPGYDRLEMVLQRDERIVPDTGDPQIRTIVRSVAGFRYRGLPTPSNGSDTAILVYLSPWVRLLRPGGVQYAPARIADYDAVRWWQAGTAVDQGLPYLVVGVSGLGCHAVQVPEWSAPDALNWDTVHIALDVKHDPLPESTPTGSASLP